MSQPERSAPSRRAVLGRLLRAAIYVAPCIGVMSMKNVAVAQASAPDSMGNMGKGNMFMYGDMDGGGMDMA